MNPKYKSERAAQAAGGATSGRTGSLFLLAMIGLSLLTGCGRAAAGAGPGAGGPPGAGRPPVVGVMTVAPAPVELTDELPGRTSPYRIAEIRARVSGIVLKRAFTEGSDVHEGQLLFEIDPAAYVAALASARATLAHAEASVVSARAQADRYATLIAANAISRQDYDNARATLLADEADVASGQAAVATAEINLGYTRITSPLSGRVGRSSVTEGALVQESQATLLATVQQLDPIYVDLEQSSAAWLQLKAAVACGRLKEEAADRASVTLVTEDGQNYPLAGTMEFSEVTVDTSTGSLVMRALFPNPEQRLLPGMFVRARVSAGMDPAAILVPQLAVSRNDRGEASVLLVNQAGQTEPRPLVAERSVGTSWLVTQGLNPGDRVIVEGLQMLRPGMPVTPIPARPLTASAQ